MPGFPLTVGTSMSCFHQAPAAAPPVQTAVTILAQPVATALSQFAVAGCPFAPSGAPQPCVTITWSSVATKVTVQAQPVLLMPPPGTGLGPGTCIGAGPQGTPTVKANQVKVTML
jgi:hypothetical protein